MYLEPDQKNKFGMLEALDQAVKNYEKESCDIVSLENVDSLADRYHSYWHILDLWLRLIENGGSLSGNLEKEGIRILLYMGLECLGFMWSDNWKTARLRLFMELTRGGKGCKSGFPCI